MDARTYVELLGKDHRLFLAVGALGSAIGLIAFGSLAGRDVEPSFWLDQDDPIQVFQMLAIGSALLTVSFAFRLWSWFTTYPLALAEAADTDWNETVFRERYGDVIGSLPTRAEDEFESRPGKLPTI